MNKITTTNIVVIIALVVLAVWLCNKRGENFAQPRGASMRSLKDNAYGKRQLPSFSENVRYDLDTVLSHVSNDSVRNGISCTKNSHCSKGDICVTAGAYTGSHVGTCMNPREPFASPVSCSPGNFFNEVAGRCEPIFQGPMGPQPLQRPEVWIPGSVTPGYGVGLTDPFDVKTNYTIY